MTEKEYYRKQAKLMADLITILGGILTAIMSVGDRRRHEHDVRRRQPAEARDRLPAGDGLSPRAIWLAFMVESLLLAGLGAALGCGVDGL